MVYLIRHTTPAIEAGVCYGRSDLALADTAPREIAAVLCLHDSAAYEADERWRIRSGVNRDSDRRVRH